MCSTTGISTDRPRCEGNLRRYINSTVKLSKEDIANEGVRGESRLEAPPEENEV
jgi:hypothetical protein